MSSRRAKINAYLGDFQLRPDKFRAQDWLHCLQCILSPFSLPFSIIFDYFRLFFSFHFYVIFAVSGGLLPGSEDLQSHKC